ncbi:MAG: 5-oxoprolinase subunit PxpB [Desulfobacterales bacterium]|jgi:KipI family sensor histidine kinase inhibitor|nr:5-oxoprolinase subunit PxpB [Desulfobacterales bacterium]
MALYPETIFRLMGDRGLLLELGDEIGSEVNEKVRRMTLAIQAESIEGIVEIVPTYRSLLILYNSLILSFVDLKKRLERIEKGLQQTPFPEPKLTQIPALYGGSYGPDLEEVAKYHQISPEEVIQLHCSKPYFIYMIGFMPGFPYMGELPEALITSRLKTPRLSVPAGSVAIAQRQTGIYPMESPGGWQIIGRTPVKLFNPEREPPALLQMGNLVQFFPISEKEFKEWHK